ncbi:site-specific integrase [Sphaerotilus sp.]|uniref:site-specific integrase n=1 Tax=Sphaerotilus sp. TaxID=2093942 RepID=UPI002ACE6BA7|nr:site-specific integrase [Sphaerotilus sp.]MDZ7855911.1 site-specific integrase [Sphaerotilus sp.]
MNSESITRSVAMLRAVVAGRSYSDVAAEHGLARTSVERRVKTLAVRLHQELNLPGVGDDGVVHVRRLRLWHAEVEAVLARFEPSRPAPRPSPPVLSDADVRLALQRARLRSPMPTRDVALVALLFATGVRPLELARMTVGDYLRADGSVRAISLLRAEVSVNRKNRPLYFVSPGLHRALDAYLEERRRVTGSIGTRNATYLGFDPEERLLLNDQWQPYNVDQFMGARGKTRYLCRAMLVTCRKVFGRIAMPGVSALTVRRTVAARLAERGADEKQIGEILGIYERKAVRGLLPQSSRKPEDLMSGLV